MEAMRDLLRTSLGKSLASLSPLDRLATAWPIAAGHAIAERSQVTSLDERTVTVTVADAGWQAQLRSIGRQLQGDLERISRVPLTDILFVLPSESAVAAESARSKPAAKPATGQRRFGKRS